MVGPLKKALGGFTHLLVAIDKFTKKIEEKPITTIDSKEAAKFFLDIVYRFGVPNSIITDNGTNFTGHYFQEFTKGYGIRIDWASVGHPRTNGQVERANGPILQGLKPRIFDKLKKFAGRWVEELPAVLWSLRTTPNWSTGLTPFFLTYDSEAVLPSDLDYDAPRVKAFDPPTAAEAQRDAMEVLEEARLATLRRSVRYQQTSRRYHERCIRERTLQVGDLVLRRVMTTKDKHKLSPPQEGPYSIAEVIRPGTYKLKDSDGKILTKALFPDQAPTTHLARSARGARPWSSTILLSVVSRLYSPLP
ncbi:uncharacterized protein LOC120681058 [Panicum virgatum]|uniref:uncharacterized protein LOC120681058 n=1 Tax=Panicum virgatum TaxID=38727 RepID=UPI0019D50133|nr:uncharacterized protein LOC120681058 [Panicum virgatum]